MQRSTLPSYLCLILLCLLQPVMAQEDAKNTPPKVIERSLGNVHVLFVEPRPERKFARSLHDELCTNDSPFTPFAFLFEEVFELPRRLEIVFLDIDMENCWYSPAEHRVTITYPMIEFLYKCSESTGQTDHNKRMSFAMGCILAIFFHEMGHAIIGEMGIPVVGREEDAADEFSTLWMLMHGSKVGEEFIGHTIDLYNVLGANHQQVPYWDEHSLNQQRAFSLLLTLYAYNPQAYEKLVSSVVPEQSMARARYDFPEKKARWNKLLKPYMKTEFLKKRPILFP